MSEAVTITIPEWIQYAFLIAAVTLLSRAAVRYLVISIHKVAWFRLKRVDTVDLASRPAGRKVILTVPLEPLERRISSSAAWNDNAQVFWRGLWHLMVRWAYQRSNRSGDLGGIYFPNLNANNLGPGIDHPHEELREQMKQRLDTKQEG